MKWTNAVFMRGGTSKGLFFAEHDLPALGPERDALLLAALGSPDRFGRQLDGMGGGLSSLSKVVTVTAADRPDAALDYTFGQVAVDEPLVDYSANCGNLSSAVVPFALESGLLTLEDGHRTVRVRNTNTDALIEVGLEVRNGTALTAGDLALPGVSGTGAPIELRYLHPAGSRTGALLPSGSARTVLAWRSRAVEASLVDAALPMVFVRAADLGIEGTEFPAQLDEERELQALLEGLRCAGAAVMGLTDASGAAPLAAPKIAIVAEPLTGRLIDGSAVGPHSCDLTMRVISMGQAHRATPGTTALCTAAAAQIPGSLVRECVGAEADGSSLRISTPSGVVTAGAAVNALPDGTTTVESASLYRTARVLMRGQVAVPAG